MHTADESHGLGAETSISTDRKAWGQLGTSHLRPLGLLLGTWIMLVECLLMIWVELNRQMRRRRARWRHRLIWRASIHVVVEIQLTLLRYTGRHRIRVKVICMLQKTMRDRLQSELTNKTQSNAKHAIVTKVLRMRSLSDVLAHVAWSRF
jgi:hypothetical protein